MIYATIFAKITSAIELVMNKFNQQIYRQISYTLFNRCNVVNIYSTHPIQI